MLIWKIMESDQIANIFLRTKEYYGFTNIRHFRIFVFLAECGL